MEGLRAATTGVPPTLTRESVVAAAATSGKTTTRGLEAIRNSGVQKWIEQPKPETVDSNLIARTPPFDISAPLDAPGSPEWNEQNMSIGARLAVGEKISLGEATMLMKHGTEGAGEMPPQATIQEEMMVEKPRPKPGQVPRSTLGSGLQQGESLGGAFAGKSRRTPTEPTQAYLSKTEKYLLSTELQKFVLRAVLGQAGINPEKWRPGTRDWIRKEMRRLTDPVRLKQVVTAITRFDGARGEKQCAFFIAILRLGELLWQLVEKEITEGELEVEILEESLDSVVPDIEDDATRGEGGYPVPDPETLPRYKTLNTPTGRVTIEVDSEGRPIRKTE
jgi:hypothetical protein